MQSLVLKWHPPIHDGGAEVSGYRVEMRQQANGARPHGHQDVALVNFLPIYRYAMHAEVPKEVIASRPLIAEGVCGNLSSWSASRLSCEEPFYTGQCCCFSSLRNINFWQHIFALKSFMGPLAICLNEGAKRPASALAAASL